jgi:hypothetical protein
LGAVADERIALIFEESRRALDQQEKVLDNLRARAGLLLTAAAIASSFLGATALADGKFCVWSWLAIGSLLALGWFAIKGVLWPRQDAWTFTHSVADLLKHYVDAAEREWDIDGMHAAMAERNEKLWDENEKQLEPMFTAFRYAAVALLFEVVFWLVDLGACGGG